MAINIKQSCFIEQTPERVFDVITDFAAYAQWNPWVISAEGQCVENGQVSVQAKLGNKIGRYEHKILAIEKAKRFVWCDVGWFTYFVDASRTRLLHAKGEGTELEVILQVTGFLSPLVSLMYHKALAQGMLDEILALKQRAESYGQG